MSLMWKEISQANKKIRHHVKKSFKDKLFKFKNDNQSNNMFEYKKIFDLKELEEDELINWINISKNKWLNNNDYPYKEDIELKFL